MFSLKINLNVHMNKLLKNSIIVRNSEDLIRFFKNYEITRRVLNLRIALVLKENLEASRYCLSEIS
jgi:hypothetical protein